MRMDTKSVPTRGRTLDYAAVVYDFFEPILLLGKQAGYHRQIMGDMVDLTSDLQRKRHNYVESVIYHELDSNRCDVSFSIRQGLCKCLKR